MPLVQRFLALILIVPLLTNCLGERAASAEPAPRINCRSPHQLEMNLAPVGAGPLTLAQIYCQIGPSHSAEGMQVAPDGNSLAYYDYYTLLRAARLDAANAWTNYRAGLGPFVTFSANIRSARAFTWHTSSRFLWAATYDTVRPSGFATGPMRPVRAAEDGSLQPLPELRHDAGPLDALLWAGGDGLAAAQFGSRGGLYRPEHDDPTPTFALVDAQRGLVLDGLPFETIPTLRGRPRGAAAYARVDNAAAAVLPDGRVRVLLSVGSWVVWTQGEMPRILPDPYLGELSPRMVLSPDGSRVLVSRLHRTNGGYCIEPRGCFPGRPVAGVLAALHDLETGRELWTIRATATNDYEFPMPAISQDGRYALVGLMPERTNVRIALVSMDDGKVVQTIPVPGGIYVTGSYGAYAMGFARDGRTVWTSALGLTALYDLAPARR